MKGMATGLKLVVLVLVSVCASGKHLRPRVYILMDISSLESGVAEPDDAQSLVRFMFYANEFTIEGFGATYTSHKDTIYPDYIKCILLAYDQSLDPLKQHGEYPDSKSLINKIKRGNPGKGTDQIGNEKNTELSDHLIEVLKENNQEPLWILIWGGSLDLAQALWKIKTSMPAQTAKKLISSIRVYSVGDQYDESGKWIRDHFKELFFILNNGSFRGMYKTGDTSLVSSHWVETNIVSKPSPLAQIYPNYNGRDPWGKVNGIKEGDTPSFLILLPQSPGDPGHPVSGSWGGIFKRIAGTNHYTDGKPGDTLFSAENISRWRADFQSDFIKRLSWVK